jgi:O-antigen ligase
MERVEINFVRSVLSFESLLVLSLLPSLYLQWLVVFDAGSVPGVTNLNFLILAVAVLLSGLLVGSRITMPRTSLHVLGLYLVFVLYASVSLLWTSDVGYGFFKTVRLATVVLWGVAAVVVVVSTSRRRTRRFFTALSVYATVYALIALYVLSFTTLSYGRGEFDFILSGRLAGLSVIGMGGVALYARRPTRRLVGAAAALVSTGVLLSVGTRTPLVALIVIGAFAAVSQVALGDGVDVRAATDRLRDHRLEASIGVALAGTVAVAWVVWRGVPRTLERLLRLFVSGPGESLSGRFELYERALRTWVAAPLRGQGIGSFAAQAPLPYPHNVFLEVLTETGVIGFALVAVLLLVSTAHLLRLYLHTPGAEQFLVTTTFLYFLVNATVSGDLPDNRMLFVLAGFVGIYSFVGGTAIE